jgi:CheY-like chemotaxis protein
MIVLDQNIDGKLQDLTDELQNSLVFGDIPILTLGIAQDELKPRKPIDYITKPLDFAQFHVNLKKYEVNHEAPLVMVIDDAYDNRVVTSLLLRRAGWRVFSCENGRVGLAQLIERNPAVIILDLKMPDMDGYEFLTHVRKDETWFHVPVIVFTATTPSEEDALRIKGQVAEVVVKGTPQAYHQLVEKVNSLING